MTEQFPVVVVGAGPAGVTAATAIAEHGVEVTLLDDQSSPGGQIYRSVTESKLLDPLPVLGVDYVAGKTRVDRFLNSSARYLPDSTVWGIDRERNVSYLRDDASHECNAAHLILTVGSQERPMPFPGWQLPGVMTAGAAQILLKSHGMLPQSSPVLVGSGPLLLLLANQYVNAGIRVEAIVDTTPHRRYLSAMQFLPGAIMGSQQLAKGVGFMRAIRSAGIPVFRGATALRCIGDQTIRSIQFAAGGESHEVATELALIHQGVIPQLQLAKLAGCQLEYRDHQQCWSAAVDQYGESSTANIYLAGDGQAIGGAETAAVSGHLCALNVLKKLGRLNQQQFDQLAKPLLLEKKKYHKLRRFIDALYLPADEFISPSDDTLVCRCEEVNAQTIREIARQGCQGPNQAKSFSRCGMGHCQGRFCEATVSAIIAKEQSRSVQEVGYYRVRPPVKALTLGQLGRAVQQS